MGFSPLSSVNAAPGSLFLDVSRQQIWRSRMKQIEKFLIVIMILTIISIYVTYFSNILLVKLYGYSMYAEMSLFSKLIASIRLVFKFLVHICIAICCLSRHVSINGAGWFWASFLASWRRFSFICSVFMNYCEPNPKLRLIQAPKLDRMRCR